MIGGSLASALMAPPDMPDAAPDTPDAAPAAPVTASAAPPPATRTATPDTVPPQMNQPTQPMASTAQDLPRFGRMKAALVGFLTEGIPGVVAGAIDPAGMQRQVQQRSQMAQAKLTFANAQAAHEVAQAHQSDIEMQALPEKLRQEAEGRGFDNVVKAKQAGYVPIASIALDQGTTQNTQNALTAMNDVQQKFGGTVPSGLVYIHTGNGMTVLKLQDTSAALPLVNQTLRAQGMPQLSQDQFNTLNPQDRDNLARNAITFTAPMDQHGEISQDSLNIASYRLATLQAQPDFIGKDQLVSQLQATANHYQAVLDSGAGAAAIRAGKAKGAEAVAAQPGTTAAQVANIQATAGPEAQAAGAKAGAEAAAKFPWEERLEKMKQGGDPVFAYDPVNKQTVQISRSEAQDKGFTNIVKVGQPEIDKAKTSAMQLGDAAMNITAYKQASQKMDDLSLSDKRTVAALIGDDKFKAHFMGASIPVDWYNQLLTEENWRALPESAKDAVVNYIAARPAAISLLRAINPGVRLTESQIETELKNIPSPVTPGDIRDRQFARLDRNIDQASKTLVKVPGVDLPSEIRDRLNAQQPAAQPQGTGQGKTRGQFKPLFGGFTEGAVGQRTSDGKRVTKVYPDGSYDAQ